MFKFKPHIIDTTLPEAMYGQTAIADIDNDGKPEFITGQQKGTIYYYKYITPDKWERFILGENSPSDVGGIAFDVDGDGWIDFVTGGAWYKNSRKVGEPFERIVFDPKLDNVHDILACDIDGDGKDEILTMSDKNDIRWYKISDDPTDYWQHTYIGTPVHAGLAVGDITGNGSMDVIRTDDWYENVNGDGTKWIEHPLPFPPQNPELLEFDFMVRATYSAVVDVNGDGVNDILMLENEMTGGKVFWLENINGDGSKWIRHDIFVPEGKPLRGALHTFVCGDFDGDGDVDLFSCEMEDIRGEEEPKFYIWENVDGKGLEWKVHIICDINLGGHDALMADFTGNGLPDIITKPWRTSEKSALNGNYYALFLENTGK